MPMQTVQGWSRSHEKATTVIHAALSDFQVATGLIPRVVLLPRRVFEQYASEQALIESVMPSGPDAGIPGCGHGAGGEGGPVRGSDGWADVSEVEHSGIEWIEVY